MIVYAKPQRSARPVRIALVVALSATVATTAPAQSSDTVVAVDRAALQRAKPGAVLRVWPLEGGVRAGVKGYRVLYRTTGINGEPVAATGAIIFPAAPATTKRDVVAWAHPTTGVATACAPTLLPDLSGTIQGIDELNDRGYVVVATDYIGLGTRDVHPYLIGVPAANAVLDSVRAAQQLHDSGAGRRFAVWGHSQGGHGALYTGLTAKSYAPELELVGVAAAAPATDLVTLFDADKDTESGRSLTAMAVLSWSRVFGVPLGEMVQANAETQFTRLANDCIESISDFFKEERDEKALVNDFLKVNPVKDQRLHAIMQENSPGPLPAGTPVFIAQSSADTLVLPRITEHYVSTLCKHGAKVTFHKMSGSSHMTSGRDSAYAAVEWMSKRFSGEPAPNQC